MDMRMEETEQKLKRMVEELWKAGPYKIILSNVRKAAPEEESSGRQYRKIVLNRLDTCWQAEKYTDR